MVRIIEIIIIRWNRIIYYFRERRRTDVSAVRGVLRCWKRKRYCRERHQNMTTTVGTWTTKRLRRNWKIMLHSLLDLRCVSDRVQNISLLLSEIKCDYNLLKADGQHLYYCFLNQPSKWKARRLKWVSFVTIVHLMVYHFTYFIMEICKISNWFLVHSVEHFHHVIGVKHLTLIHILI